MRTKSSILELNELLSYSPELREYDGYSTVYFKKDGEECRLTVSKDGILKEGASLKGVELSLEVKEWLKDRL